MLSWEKPVAVDPVGARQVMEVGRRRPKRKLSAGGCRHAAPPQNGYIENDPTPQGRTRSAKFSRPSAYWNGGQVWFKKREQGWSDMELDAARLEQLELAGRRPHRRAARAQPGTSMNWVLGHPRRWSRWRRGTGASPGTCMISSAPISPTRARCTCSANAGDQRLREEEVSERVIASRASPTATGGFSKLGEIEVTGRTTPTAQEHGPISSPRSAAG